MQFRAQLLSLRWLKKEEKENIIELMMKGYKIGRTAYEIDSSLVQI